MKNWPWIIYGFLLTIIITQDTRDIFLDNPPLLMYYTILIALNKYYIVYLVFNIISIFINFLALLIVFYYAFNIKCDLKFWKICFFLRIFFDLTGHNYNWQTIKASFSQSFFYGLLTVIFFTIPFIFSYIAHYQHVFRNPANKTTYQAK